jgi:uncharacterized protein DUF3854/uncharacterized protein DUF927
MPSWRNARRGDPCAVCGKPSWCSRSDDGVWALCRRVGTDGIHRVDSAGMDYWLHRLGDSPAPPPVVPDEPRAERAAAEDLDRVYRAVLAQLSLSPAHRSALAARGLDAEAIASGMYRTLPPRGRAELSRAVLERFPERLVLSVPGFHRQDNGRGAYVTFGGAQGLLVPVLDVEGRVVALKVRVDKADDDGPRYFYVSSTGHGGPGPGAPVHVPARASADGAIDDDGSLAVVRVTEGELKANVATALSGILTVSVPGVSAWRGALPVLRALRPARVLLAFDADAATNAHVARATEATAAVLSREGWDVAIEVWDGEQAKGIDDALAAGIEIGVRTCDVPTTPDPTVEEREEASCYKATKGGLVWIRPTKDGPVEQRLTNFTARIVNDVMEDDGAEVRRRFEIEAGLLGCRRTFIVAAESFAGMGWATEQLGARAIVFPGFGTRDHARAAVQILSADIPERHVFSHTGWRDLGQAGWAYLHAGGAVGARGVIPGVEVSLPDSLTRLELPPPPEADDLQDAVLASLGVIDVAPDRVVLPLLAAVYRAVLGETDFSVQLAGSSGAGKSELAALAQRHFGHGMDARNLPGSWSSTANALEGLAFAAKDALLVVDDFAPSGSVTDTERAHREADRILRAQGNRSGRLRMRADGSLRTARPPRGLILSTGEDVPRGQSLRARMLVLELERSDVDWDALTRCQRAAAEGALARSMSGFLRWLAPRYEDVRGGLAAQLPALREAASRSGAHRRTPELVANLSVGFGLFLVFARSVGALVDAECQELCDRAWGSLGEAAASQAHHQAGAEPAQRFVELLRSALASGRAHLAGPKGGKPEEDEGAWGWRRNDYGHDEPYGARIGWLDGEGVWLDPDASYAAAQRLGQEVGDRLAVQPQTLRKRLNERGLLASTDVRRKTLTLRKSFEGQRREVLHLDRETLSPPVAESTQPDQIDLDGPADGASWEGFATVWEGLVNFGNGHLPRENGHLPAVSSQVVKLVNFSTHRTPRRSEGQ